MRLCRSCAVRGNSPGAGERSLSHRKCGIVRPREGRERRGTVTPRGEKRGECPAVQELRRLEEKQPGKMPRKSAPRATLPDEMRRRKSARKGLGRRHPASVPSRRSPRWKMVSSRERSPWMERKRFTATRRNIAALSKNCGRVRKPRAEVRGVAEISCYAVWPAVAGVMQNPPAAMFTGRSSAGDVQEIRRIRPGSRHLPLMAAHFSCEAWRRSCPRGTFQRPAGPPCRQQWLAPACFLSQGRNTPITCSFEILTFLTGIAANSLTLRVPANTSVARGIQKPPRGAYVF
jgi:hypothetical protein